MTQDSALSHDTPVFAPNSPQNKPSFDLAVAADDFDNGIFEDEERNQDDDKISLGSEDEDGDFECDVQGEENVKDDGVPWEPSDIGGEDGDVLYGSPSFPHHEDAAFHSYTRDELRLLKQVDVDLPMAHPVYPLLETAYDAKHRAHLIADEGMEWPHEDEGSHPTVAFIWKNVPVVRGNPVVATIATSMILTASPKLR
ncbi:hypothetical protein C2845_PM04G14620 [Panicum miliaceum]|uniref:Uncharacterized protein n=1 Tax=Panicum miliaceum TaxID=4540 RepID=A0A3L6QMY4_PANMI|nr:hypothetical protein C2845_PM04G14620 [Panicum miliaceum]